jgi:hypothetical protein
MIMLVVLNVLKNIKNLVIDVENIVFIKLIVTYAVIAGFKDNNYNYNLLTFE